jgi:hypothetical protein
MPPLFGVWAPRLAFASILLASVSPTALLADSDAAAPRPGHWPAPQLVDSAGGEEGETAGESGSGDGESGESGEGEAGGSGPFAGAEPNELLLGQLLMTRGHLMIGYSLAAQQMMDAAKPHLHHPIEENYPLIEDAIEDRKLQPFEDELEELSEAGERTLPEILPDYQSAMSKIDADVSAVLAADADRTELALDTALRVLKQAADEYKESIEDGVIAEAVEYQDAMAFVAEARRLVEGEAEALVARDGARYSALLQEFDALQKAWPSQVPPRVPVLSTEAVYGGVSRIEIAMLPLKG